MNIENNGRTLAVIKGGKYDKKFVSIEPMKSTQENEDNEQLIYHPFSDLKLPRGCTFSQYPNLEIGSNNLPKRSVLYVTGMSGSGKSYYVKSFCQNYMKAFPKNRLFIFSQLVEDDSLKDLGDKLLRVKIDEQLVLEPFSYKDFSNSCVIFDDVDALKNKIIKKAVLQLKSEMAELGRHENITMCITSHQTCKGHETKESILESTSCTFFMKGGNNYTTMLKNYMGFTNNQIKALKKINSRWVTIFKEAPQVIMTENRIFLKELFDDDLIKDL
jgi:hypothetical protein